MNRKIFYVKDYVTDLTKCYGNVGEVTPFIIDGQYLQVGDVVELFGGDGHYSKQFVVMEGNQSFIMGIKTACKNNGEILHGWNVKLVKKYHEVKDGDIIGDLAIVDANKRKEETSFDEKIIIVDYNDCNCTICNRDAAFIIYLDEYYSDRAVILCPDCLANLGKKIIDALR